MTTNTAFWAVMVVSAAMTAYGIYDGSGLEIGIGLGIAAIAVIGTLISDAAGKRKIK